MKVYLPTGLAQLEIIKPQLNKLLKKNGVDLDNLDKNHENSPPAKLAALKAEQRA